MKLKLFMMMRTTLKSAWKAKTIHVIFMVMETFIIILLILIYWRIDMTKFKVVRYWDTYPDGVVATCDTEEEAEKICKEYLKKRKPMYDYLVRKENE